MAHRPLTFITRVSHTKLMVDKSSSIDEEYFNQLQANGFAEFGN